MLKACERNATLLKHTCEDLSCQLGGAACLIVNQFVDVGKSFGISTLTSISTYSARVNTTNKMVHSLAQQRKGASMRPLRLHP